MYLLVCKKSELSIADMEYMTIGMCLDYVDEYMEMKNPDKKQKAKKANQADFDRF